MVTAELLSPRGAAKASDIVAFGVAARMVLMAIIGGRATVAGPVIGAILIVGISEFSVIQFGATEFNIVVIGAILLAVLLFFPWESWGA